MVPPPPDVREYVAGGTGTATVPLNDGSEARRRTGPSISNVGSLIVESITIVPPASRAIQVAGADGPVPVGGSPMISAVAAGCTDDDLERCAGTDQQVLGILGAAVDRYRVGRAEVRQLDQSGDSRPRLLRYDVVVPIGRQTPIAATCDLHPLDRLPRTARPGAGSCTGAATAPRVTAALRIAIAGAGAGGPKCSLLDRPRNRRLRAAARAGGGLHRAMQQ
jgi:hypothetical protein